MAQRWEARTIGEISPQIEAWLRRLTFAEFCVAPIPNFGTVRISDLEAVVTYYRLVQEGRIQPWLNRKDSLAA